MLSSLERDIKEESCVTYVTHASAIVLSEVTSLPHSRIAPLLWKKPQHYPRVLPYAEIPSKCMAVWPRDFDLALQNVRLNRDARNNM